MTVTPKVWAKYAWVFHLCSMVFLAGVAWASVSSQSVRIDKLELDTKDIPATLARIEQKVDDMHDNYRSRP